MGRSGSDCPSHIEPVSEDYAAARSSVRQGCTGLWQLSVASSGTATSAPRFDLFYLRHASTRMDIWILIRTVGWMLGWVKPIEIVDIPRSVLGPGLLTDAELRAITEQSAVVHAAQERVRWMIEDRPPEQRGFCAAESRLTTEVS